MALSSGITPFELESERESFLNKVPNLGYYSSIHSWTLPQCKVWPLIAFMATAMAGSLLLGVTIVSHAHPEPTPTTQEILGAALDIEALVLPGAATRQEMQEGRIEIMKEAGDLSPTYLNSHGTDVVWQIPPHPTSVVFLAHSCHRHATSFWDHHPNCTACRGLPEEVEIVRAALKRSYAVIAVKSKGVCWNTHWPPTKSPDISTLLPLLHTWRVDHGLTALPLFALGISSGGNFVTLLATALHVSSLALWRIALYPCAVPKDARLAAQVASSVSTLRGHSVQVAELKLQEMPLTPLFFHNRIPGVNRTVSEELYGTMKLEGFLDDKGRIKQDPRKSNWWKHFEKHQFLGSGGEGKWREAIAEELNVAYGFHEISSAKVSETFDWFKNRCWYRGRYRHRRCQMFHEATEATKK